jgi:hypothetical protein
MKLSINRNPKSGCRASEVGMRKSWRVLSWMLKGILFVVLLLSLFQPCKAAYAQVPEPPEPPEPPQPVQITPLQWSRQSGWTAPISNAASFDISTWPIQPVYQFSRFPDQFALSQPLQTSSGQFVTPLAISPPPELTFQVQSINLQNQSLLDRLASQVRLGDPLNQMRLLENANRMTFLQLSQQTRWLTNQVSAPDLVDLQGQMLVNQALRSATMAYESDLMMRDLSYTGRVYLAFTGAVLFPGWLSTAQLVTTSAQMEPLDTALSYGGIAYDLATKEYGSLGFGIFSLFMNDLPFSPFLASGIQPAYMSSFNQTYTSPGYYANYSGYVIYQPNFLPSQNPFNAFTFNDSWTQTTSLHTVTIQNPTFNNNYYSQPITPIQPAPFSQFP